MINDREVSNSHLHTLHNDKDRRHLGTVSVPTGTLGKTGTSLHLQHKDMFNVDLDLIGSSFSSCMLCSKVLDFVMLFNVVHQCLLEGVTFCINDGNLSS